MSDLSARLERIVHLETRLARTPLTGRLRRALSVAIRTEAAAYCRSLDAARAAAARHRDR